MKDVIIRPGQKWKIIDFGQLWRYRELFYIFTWRDIKVRYKQTLLGVLWVILQPLVTMFIFTAFFGKLAKIPSGDLPYQLFVFIGLVFWTFFSSSVTMASNSMVENTNIIKKVYFPREILPISASVTCMVDFFINLGVVILMGFYFHFTPSLLFFIIAPVGIIITIMAGTGLGFFLASLNIKYRDVRYILPFLIQTMLFLTPVIYPIFSVRDSLRQILALNPMTGVIESMRAVFSGSNQIDFQLLIISTISAIILMLFGLIYFRSTERFFADIA